MRRSRPGKSWCPDFNSIPSGFNIKDTCYTVPYSARNSFGLGVGMILMFMSRRQRYDWRLILLCLLHATRASPCVGRSSHWIYCSFLFSTQDSPFWMDQDISSGRGHVPYSRVVNPPGVTWCRSSYLIDLFNFAGTLKLTKRVVLSCLVTRRSLTEFQIWWMIDLSCLKRIDLILSSNLKLPFFYVSI